MTITACSRRKFLGAVGAAAGAWLAGPTRFLAAAPPAGRVAVGMCPDYGPPVVATMAAMFDQLGGLERLVRGKTVAVKLNLTGDPFNRLWYLPVGDTHWVHPDVIGATVHLLGQAGASRIRLLESAQSTAEPLEEFMLQANWEPRDFMSAAPRVEFENTNYLGLGKKYSRFMVPGGGLMYAGYDLNHSYEDCDVFVSLAKLKEHMTAGVTLSMKNCFGMTPCTIYGDGSPVDEPSLRPHGWPRPVPLRVAIARQERTPLGQPQRLQRRGLPRAARGGGPGGRPARASRHRRWHPYHDGRRRPLDHGTPLR